jgi:hypothetical protein
MLVASCAYLCNGCLQLVLVELATFIRVNYITYKVLTRLFRQTRCLISCGCNKQSEWKSIDESNKLNAEQRAKASFY